MTAVKNNPRKGSERFDRGAGTAPDQARLPSCTGVVYRPLCRSLPVLPRPIDITQMDHIRFGDLTIPVNPQEPPIRHSALSLTAQGAVF